LGNDLILAAYPGNTDINSGIFSLSFFFSRSLMIVSISMLPDVETPVWGFLPNPPKRPSRHVAVKGLTPCYTSASRPGAGVAKLEILAK
jgi:hypothetical protein